VLYCDRELVYFVRILFTQFGLGERSLLSPLGLASGHTTTRVPLRINAAIQLATQHTTSVRTFNSVPVRSTAVRIQLFLPLSSTPSLATLIFCPYSSVVILVEVVGRCHSVLFFLCWFFSPCSFFQFYSGFAAGPWTLSIALIFTCVGHLAVSILCPVLVLGSVFLLSDAPHACATAH